MSQVTAMQHENQTRSLVATWAALVGLTLASVWFSDHGLGPAAAVTMILALTFVKVYMVGHSFMELGHAPPFLKAMFIAWCAGTCAVLVVLAFVL